MCYTIDEIRQKAIPIAMQFGIDKVYLFGSYARGEAKDDSDIDVCIEKGRMRSLLQYYSFVSLLEKEFNCHVDVVTTDAPDKTFLEIIMKDGIVLYERQR